MTQTLDLHLRRMPRVALLDLATPIQRLRRIEAALGEQLNGIGLFVKRDDVMGLGGGGNKLRKLEFLLGDAIAQGADTIITVGGRQSNHARLTAAAAARYGLRCELVLGLMVARDDEDYTENGNIILDDLFGATIHDVAGNVSTLAVAEERAEILRASGRKVYVAPTGASSVGCLGYAACASEIAAQSAAQDIHFQHIIVPNGSGGMHAGLSAGFAALGAGAAKVKLFAVLARVEDARRGTLEKINATLALLESPGVSPDEPILAAHSLARVTAFRPRP
ncbi:pyridoxal-phosphate dependent enzyme [Bradyrhizobium sp. 187]|jgi:L-cysteate sulfo-lyase|uniref:pyridoxal-phosphate dependent enzyme n=1 Tax=Bradyrhizobium sp. 187 TaxID=2782655 RepID=UPI0031FC431C